MPATALVSVISIAALSPLPLAVLPLSFGASRPIEHLSPTNATQLKAVFFSGEPWLVQCANANELMAHAIDKKLGVHEIVEKAMAALPKEAQVGMLDCWHKLPSGKSTIDRFKMDVSYTPLLLLAANGKPPKQVVPSLLTKFGGITTSLFPSMRQHAGALAQVVRAYSVPKAVSLTRSEHLTAHCLKRKHCVLVLSRGDLGSTAGKLLTTLMHEYRIVGFGTINTQRYEFSLSKHLPLPPPAEAGGRAPPQILALTSTPSTEGKKKLVALSAKAHRGDFSLSELRSFLDAHVGGTLEMTPLRKAPTLRWKKQEKSKRAAQENRSRKPAKGGGSAPRGGAKAGGSGRQRGAKGAARAGAGGGASDGGGVDEQERRRRMAEEEEEYLRSMFGEGDEGEAADGEDAAGGDEDESEDEEVLDLDLEEIDADDIADDAEEERFDGEEFEQAEESVDVEVGADGSVGGAEP